MAHPTPTGLSPSEIAFLCEMELVTVIPRERLASLRLLSGNTPDLRPPRRADLPLWLALLLKRQKRADIAPPPWLNAAALQAILESETSASSSGGGFTPAPPLAPPPPSTSTTARTAARARAEATPPFQQSNTASAPQAYLPYHWLELSQLLLAHASDDIADAEAVRRTLRDLREVRAAKVRASLGALDAGAGLRVNGVGALEVGESRAFVTGVIDGLRRVGAAREAQGREEADEMRERGGGYGEGSGRQDEDEDML